MTDLSNMSREQLEAFAKQMADKVAKAKEDATRALTYKVSEKGCMSIYGLGRFPTTLYAGQWERLIKEVKDGRVEAKLVEFADKLKRKED